MSVYDELTTADLTPALDGAWIGEIAADVTSVTALATFVLPDLDEHLKFPPCRWQPRPERLSVANPAAYAAITGAGDVATLKAAVAAAFDLPVTRLPKKGDACLVVFDSRGDPWIPAWWPS